MFDFTAGQAARADQEVQLKFIDKVRAVVGPVLDPDHVRAYMRAAEAAYPGSFWGRHKSLGFVRELGLALLYGIDILLVAQVFLVHLSGPAHLALCTIGIVLAVVQYRLDKMAEQLGYFRMSIPGKWVVVSLIDYPEYRGKIPEDIRAKLPKLHEIGEVRAHYFDPDPFIAVKDRETGEEVFVAHFGERIFGLPPFVPQYL